MAKLEFELDKNSETFGIFNCEFVNAPIPMYDHVTIRLLLFSAKCLFFKIFFVLINGTVGPIKLWNLKQIYQ